MQGRPVMSMFAALVMAAAVLPASPARAQDRMDRAAERPQIAAATAEAVANLRDGIERTPINQRVTVGDFLRRTGSQDELNRALQRAELVGGPRWVDDDTCQVQLEMSGTRVAHLLEQLAVKYKKDSPVSAEEMARLSEDWRRKTFGGFGTSTSFGRAARARPPTAVGMAWANVKDAERERVLAAAKADAIGHVLDSIRPIEISKDKTVGDALANPEVRTAVTDWLENRPVTRVEYRRDMQVELTMAGTPNGCYEVVRRSVTKYTNWPLPANESRWAAVREEFERRMASPAGRATLAAPVATTVGIAPQASMLTVMPSSAPDWVDRKLEAEGVAEAGGFKLKAAREAEGIARRKLADVIGELPLGGGVTVGKAAEKDAAVRDAITQALDKAKVKTDYNHGKGVAVTLKLDLHDLWDAIKGAQ